MRFRPRIPRASPTPNERTCGQAGTCGCCRWRGCRRLPRVASGRGGRMAAGLARDVEANPVVWHSAGRVRHFREAGGKHSGRRRRTGAVPARLATGHRCRARRGGRVHGSRSRAPDAASRRPLCPGCERTGGGRIAFPRISDHPAFAGRPRSAHGAVDRGTSVWRRALAERDRVGRRDADECWRSGSPRWAASSSVPPC